MTNYEDMSKGDLISLLRKRDAPAVQGESVGWQFYQHGEWRNGDDRIKDHRKNTKEAGFRVRDVYTAPHPAPDVSGLVEALEEARDLVESWSAYASDYFKEKHNLARDLERLDAVIAAYRKQGGEA